MDLKVKCIMMSKLTLLLLFSFSLLNLQAQDWELIYQENFGTGYTGQPLPSNWESNIFNGSTLGATGGADDPCQSSLLRFYSAYLAYQMNLSDTYEYYVSMNVKTDDPAGAELIFYHNTIAEASGTVIGAPATVPTIPSNQPGQVISSAIFSDLDGAHYFIIAKGPNDPSGGDERTRIDDFKLYRRPVGGTNEVPTVILTQPTDGASFEENETIVLAATATDSDGSIQSVQFYQDQTLLLEDFNAPYEATITNGLAAGSYTLKAIATDNEGATGETTINITIDPTDTGGGGNPSDWELIYEENFGTGYTGQPLPANWEDNIFNGTTQGATGGDDDPCQSSLLRFYSAYLAYQMDLSDTYEYYVSMNLKTDDPAGAELIFYHNIVAEASGTTIGDPIAVPTIPANQPGQVMSSAIFGDLNGAHYFIIAKGPNDPSSGDERTRIDDFKLYRRPVGGANEVPTVTLIAPADGATFEENENIAISATASDLDGTVQSVQFYYDQTLISEVFSEPYQTALGGGLIAGTYTLRAVATDNGGATSEDQINITVNATPPVLPSIAFETSSLNAEEGTSVEVCLSISEAPEQAVSMEVAVSGNASPHFDDYTTTTINFPTGSTSNQCFTLNTDPIDQELSGDISYSFVLQTPVGSEIGNVNQLTVNVSDQSTQALSTISFVTATASLTAGEDLQVCLSTSEAPSALASVEVAISGNSAPHFTSFATTTVQFPIGETGNQCFNLSSLLAPEVTESTNYTFVLQNPVAAELSTSNNLVLTVNPPATGVDCPYAGPDQTICAGETIAIGCPDDPNDPSPYCFKWEPEIGFVEEFGSTQQYPTIQPEETTTYTLYVTDGNGSLIAEEEVVVNVQSSPGVSIYPSNAILCQGESVSLVALTWDDIDLFDISWSNGATTPEIDIISAGTYTVTLVNISTGCTESVSTEVILSPETVSIATSAQEVCDANPAILEAIPSIPDPGTFSYEWSTGESTRQIIVREAGTYGVTMTNASTACETTNEIEIESQGIAVTIQPEKPVVCVSANRSVSLKVEDIYTHVAWSNHSLDPTEIIGNDNELLVNNVGTYGVTVTANNGCIASDIVEVKDANTDPAAIRAFFEDKGFYSFDINITGPITLTNNPLQKSLTNTLCTDSAPCGTNTAACIQDDAQLLFSIKKEDQVYEAVDDLEAIIQQNLDRFQSEFGYQSSRAYITSNDQVCACDDYLNKVETLFEEAELGYWVHLYDAPNGEDDQFFILTNVPTSDLHYPVPDGIRNFVDEGMLTLKSPDYLGDFPEAVIATVMDRTLDNHLSQKASNENQPFAHLICENTIVSGGADVFALSPSCSLLQLPENTSLRFDLTGDWPNIVPEGALTGFSDFAAFQSSGQILYYYGRAVMPSTPDQKPSFAGYYRTTLSGEPTLDWTAYSSFPSISAPPVEEQLIITYGIPSLTEGIVTAIKVNKYPYIGSNYPASSYNAKGDIVLDFFTDPGCQVLGDVITDTNPIDIDLPSITVADINNGQYNQFGYEGIFIQREEGDGTTTYIYAVEVEGQLRTFFWDCFTGSYQEFTVTDPATLIALEARVVGKKNKYEPGDNSTPTPPVDLNELEEPSCFILPPGKLQTYSQGNSSFDEQTGVYNYAGAQGEFLQDLEENIAQTAAGNVFMKFIVTADEQQNSELNASQPSPKERFESFGGEGDNTDMVFWVHFMDDGTAGLCVKFVNDFFLLEHNDNTIEASEAIRLKEVFTTAIADAIAIKKEELFDTNPSDDQDVLSQEEPTTSTNGPWFFGLREDNTDPSFLNILSEVTRVGGGLVKTFMIEEGTWKYTSTALFQLPPAIGGVCDGLIQENPLVGIVEACKFGLSFVKDEKTRQGIVEALKNPGKVVRAIYDQKKLAYSGEQGQDVMYHTAGADVVGIISFLTGIKQLIDFLKQRKSPDGAAEGIAESADEFPDPNDLDFENLPEIYQQLKDKLDGDYSDEIKEILEFIGSEKSLKKFVDHPRLVNVYDKLRKDPGVNINNYKGVFEKLDGGDDLFFNDFLDNFVDVSGVVSEKAKNFLDDISRKNDVLEAFKKNDVSVNSWNIVKDLPTNLPNWRTDLPLLTKIDELSNNQALLSRLMGEGDLDGIDALKKILEKGQRHPYRNCACGDKWLPDIDILLEDIVNLNTLYPNNSQNSGFVQEILKELKTPLNEGTRRGRVFEMRQVVLRNNPNASLGESLPNGKKADYVDELKHMEFKSTVSVEKKFDPTQAVNDFDQLRGYLQQIKNLDRFDLVIDKKYLAFKNNLDPNDLMSVTKFAKREMQQIFKVPVNKAKLFTDIWSNSTLKQSVFIDVDDISEALDLFDTMIDELDNNLFKFIKIQ